METKNTTKKIALVFTMKKVGSSTIMQAFRDIGRNPERGYAENVGALRPFDEYEKVVILIRDPIARNLSFFFEMFGEEFLRGKHKNKAILEFFLSSAVDHIYPIRWFDEYFQGAFGIDVYKHKFAKTRGWSIVEDRYLLIQTERLSEVLPDAFDKLFGEHCKVQHRAKTKETRQYGELYGNFLAWVKFPESYVDEMYENKYVKHFYLKKQIDAMRKRWTK